MSGWMKKIVVCSVLNAVASGLLLLFLWAGVLAEEFQGGDLLMFFISIYLFVQVILFSVLVFRLRKDMDARCVSDAMAIAELKKRVEELEKK